MVIRHTGTSMSTSTASALSFTESLSLLSLTLGCVGIISNTFRGDGEPLVASLAFSGIAFAASYSMIKWLGPTFMKAGLKGKDMSKVNKKEIPETMGAVCAVVYLLMIIVFIPFPFYKDIVAATSGGGNRDVVLEIETVHTGRFLHRFPHSKLASYLSAILSLQSVCILGIGDDLFDIRWRHKFFIPGIASIPLLIVYFVDFGVTNIVIPIPLRPYLGELLDLGFLYYVYMASIAIFCPNSINILAGINGIEVSQSLVIAFLLVINDAYYLLAFPALHPATDSHLFSLYMLLPFIGVSLALLRHNWYPSAVFVGDTYCYFAGMVFAVVGICGHFSKTLLLLFIPQIFNFIYSAPQLFRIIPCPRHRLPRFNARTGFMEASVTEWAIPPKPHIAILLALLHRVKLLRVTWNEQGVVETSSNFTILNLWLVWFGPKREDRLAVEILIMQTAVGLLGLFIRHNFALLIFESDNLGGK
ncbi:probable UDP-N-acetyl-glucosamine-1-P transferase Alg7 [Rhynchosporium agropyri]|uniref:UDP-N-acetylglucosamine--dolichyl-phosphate N-acetylglucosaminephosphotransferase n=1 Tax=Rhynchosporium agropyri TaxID=914238 RepID=A0A1E1LCY3_9HELO|nr:probable UDP-N-acetyl-glucosamine-1-P transferase Alg7 [Rhynchosporium agropyri]